MYAETVHLVGTFVTIIGLVVVAPFEAGRVLPDVFRAVLLGGRRVRAWFARWLPFLRRSVTFAGSGSVAGTSRVSGSAFGRRVPGDEGSVEEQLVAIRRAVVLIHEELDGLRADQIALRHELTGRLERLVLDHAELRQSVEAYQSAERQLNAQGFPLAALGALLSGVPNPWLVTETPSGVSPTLAWWPLLAVGLVAVAVGGRWLFQSRDRVLEGWRVHRSPAVKGPSAAQP